jgi:hypothetical protein
VRLGGAACLFGTAGWPGWLGLRKKRPEKGLDIQSRLDDFGVHFLRYHHQSTFVQPSTFGCSHRRPTGVGDLPYHLAGISMGPLKPEQQIEAVIDQVLGYLNFSNGNHDPRFLKNLNLLFGEVSQESKSSQSADDESVESDPSTGASPSEPTFEKVKELLQKRLKVVAKESPTFKDSQQVEGALDVTFNQLLGAYKSFHSDLLFHQADELLFNSFFVGRAMEAVLQVGVDSETIVSDAIEKLNDFLGHRPVATLESQKIEAYSHEWIRPIPIMILESGVAHGKYQELTELALQTIAETDPHILRAAHFDLSKLSELAIDPRAFDFDHPINQRPNHHFGQWDEHLIDNSGFFRRFILHQVSLDALLSRVENLDPGEGISREEAMQEASAVLAGTMLMASGICGSGPGTYDSKTTLATLLPVIANYRDQFYDDLMTRIPESHRQRLNEESKSKHQPFGGVRQNLNAQLSQRRASQLVNCRLAAIFARMGYPDAAKEQSKVVPVASARINCQIDCLLSAANESINSGDLDEAYAAIPVIMTRLKRGIQCGAIVDPWNILGFDANYSLFPAVENTVRDFRVFELVDLMERIFALCSRLWSEAAASDREQMCEWIQKEFLAIVDWWRKYAAHEVMVVDAVDADDIFQAAELVAEALNLWHKGGAEAGDIEFWKLHAELFDSPKAYALVIDALMQRGDHSTSMALLVHWLSQAEYILLQQGDSSFHNLVYRWIGEQKRLLHSNEENAPSPDQVWTRIRKFYDFLEANADYYWDVPDFDTNRKSLPPMREGFDDPDHGDEVGEYDESLPDDENDLYSAAYDNVIYTDTTDDGFEGEVFDGSLTSDDALEAEVDRVLDRLEFLSTIAGYWGIAANVPLPGVSPSAGVNAETESQETSKETGDKKKLPPEVIERLTKRRDITLGWVDQATQNRAKLFELLESINQYRLPTSGSDHDALLQYDQQRIYKDSLLEQTINTCIETENAIRHLVAVVQAVNYLIDDEQPGVCELEESDSSDDSSAAKIAAQVNGGAPVVCAYSALLIKDASMVRKHFSRLTEYLSKQALLYVPLAKGGNPSAIVRARVVQTAILDLLRRLPTLGLFAEAYELTRTSLFMERNNPIGGGAVTEFDEIFEIAYTSMVQTLVESTEQLREQRRGEGELTDSEIKEESQSVLFDCIQTLTESMLMLWLDHSKTLRLSVVEKVHDRQSWERLVEFVKNYGSNLFTQHFLHLGNIRAILHQGVDHWLTQVEESPKQPDLRLFDELGKVLPRPKAVRYMTLVLESLIENYNEYRDYNTTTTQSDHGDSLYMFLDFLRLRSRYDRVCWNLKPVIWAHRILVNDQENGVARMWRRSLVDKVGSEADRYLEMLEELRSKYSIRMESVARRIEGRFGHQMQIDRLKALVSPAMENPHARKSYRAFDLLKQEAQAFSRTTMGVGVDLPMWLAALENEVEQHLLPQRLRDPGRPTEATEPTRIPIALIKEILEELPHREVE